MAHIRKIEHADAEGPLRRTYDEAVRRAGRIYEIVKLQSLLPDVLEAWVGYYRAVMFGPSGLSRVEREMVAAVVSATNGCHY